MKCNVCGKTISEFATVCPYCHNPVNVTMDKQTAEKKAFDYKKSTAKGKVIVGLILSCVLVLFSFISIRVFDVFGTICYVMPIPELCCIVYGLFVLFSKKIVTFSSNKLLILLSVIAGILAVLMQLYLYKYYYGTGVFRFYLAQRIVMLIPKGILVSFIIVFAHYLFSLEKRT